MGFQLWGSSSLSRVIECAGMRESTSWNHANGSTPHRLQEAMKLQKLPAEGSHAAGLFAGTPAPPDFAPIPAGAWLDEAAAARVGTLLEHSMYLANYRAVLTLLWAQTVE